MTPLAVEEIAREANLVLHGVVAAKTCVRDPDGRIVTRLQLQVTETWKGTLQTNSLTIVHGGGQVGRIRSEVSGQVEYVVREEVVVFLMLNQRGEGVTIGLAQGKFHVWKDKDTGEKFAHNIFHGKPEEPIGQAKGKAKRLGLRELANRVKGNAP